MIKNFQFHKKLNAETKNGRLQRAVLASVLAAGMVFVPSYAMASESNDVLKMPDATNIVRGDGTKVQLQNNVATVFAESVKGSTAVNRFSQFDVAKGDVANMLFRTQKSTAEANKLFNFVDSRIKIDGTVNALSKASNGGSIYFLSKQGMVVGANGVINAGSLNVMTPQHEWWDKYISDYAGDKLADNLGNKSHIKDVNLESAITSKMIPINHSGSIVILGKVNAVNEINLKSANVSVGSYNDAQGSAKSNARLTTGVTDFSSLVNTSAIDGKTASTLKFSTSGTSGNINLEAYDDYKDKTSFGVGDYKEVVATVNVGGTSQITARGKANITATAVDSLNAYAIENSAGETQYHVNGETLSEAEVKARYGSTEGESGRSFFDFGSSVSTYATINIADTAKISAANVNINALAGNVYASNQHGILSAEWIGSFLMGLLLNGWDVAYCDTINEAVVNIDKNTSITATGKDYTNTILDFKNGEYVEQTTAALNIQAMAVDSAELGTSTQGWNLLSLAEPNLVAVPGVNVNYGETHNKAEVNVNGNLRTTSTDSTLAIAANADLSMTSSVSSCVGGLASFAINVVDAENTSLVNINNDAVINAAGAASIKAVSTNLMDIETDFTVMDEGALGFGINVANYTSRSDANINASIIATKSLDINSSSSFSTNSDTVDTVMGNTWFENWIYKNVLESKTLDSTVKGNAALFNNWLSKISGTAGGGAIDSKIGGSLSKLAENGLAGDGSEDPAKTVLEKFGDYLKAGLSINYLAEDNISNVTINKGVTLRSNNGDLSITASSIIADPQLAAHGTSQNQKIKEDESDATAEVLVNGAVAVIDIANKSNVIVGDNALLYGNNITTDAKAEFQYNRIEVMLENLQEKADLTKEKFTEAFCYGLTAEETAIIQELYDKYMDDMAALEEELSTNKDAYAKDDEGFQRMMETLAEYQEHKDVKAFEDMLKKNSFTYTDAEGQEHTIILHMEERGVISNTISFFSGFAKAFGTVGAAGAFASPENYMTYSVGSSTSGQANLSPDHDESASVAISVSANINFLNNKANVIVGKNASLRAYDNLAMNANTYVKEVALDGKYGLSGGGDKMSGGLVVGVHCLDNDSMVMVAEGAQLTSYESVKGNVQNDILHIGLNLGLGSSKDNTINGTVNYLGVASNTILSIDDEATINAGKLELLGNNNTTVVNIGGGLSMGGKSAAGAVILINNIDRDNLVVIGDNDSDSEATASSDEEKRLRQRVHDNLSNIEADKLTAGLGSKATTVASSIKANDIAVDAATDGTIVTVAADVGLSMTRDADAPGIGDKITAKTKSIKNMLQNGFNQLDDPISALKNKLPTDIAPVNLQANSQMPSTSLEATGTVDVNKVSAVTAAYIDKASIGLTNNGNVNVNAMDDSAIVSVAGGVGLTWHNHTKEVNKGSNSIAFTGTASVNLVDSDVVAKIANSAIKNAGSVKNTASRSGALAAAAAPMNISIGGDVNNYSVTGGTSINLANIGTHALLENNTVSRTDTNRTNVINTAMSKDVQVAGGFNLNLITGGKKSVGVGAMAVVDQLENKVEAKVTGGSYRSLGSFINEALTSLTEISVGAGIGVSKGSEGSAAAQAVVAYSGLTNNVTSVTEGVSITADEISVKAYDTADLEPNAYKESLAKKYDLDTSGTEYIKSVGAEAELDNLASGGNTIVAGGLTVSASTGSSSTKAAVGGVAAVNVINNTYKAESNNSTFIIPDNKNQNTSVNINAESDTLAVTLAAGGAGTSGHNGVGVVGSAAINLLEGGVFAGAKDSYISAPDTYISADNHNQTINLAGSVAVSGTAVGLDVTVNALDVATKAYLTDTEIAYRSNGYSNLAVNATNDMNNLSLALGVGVSTDKAAVNGSVAINSGNDELSATVTSTKGKKLSKLSSLSIKTKDFSQNTAAAGGIQVTTGSGLAAAGGAVAWNGLGYDTVQNNEAVLSGYALDRTQNNADFTIQALDTSIINTIGAGASITTSGLATAEGAAATAFLNKNITAKASDIDTNWQRPVNLDVWANNEADIINTAVVVAGGDSTVAAGMAIAVNETKTNTNAILQNSSFYANDAKVKAMSNNDVTMVSVGGAGTHGNVSVAGSVLVNNLNDSVNAQIVDTYLVAKNIALEANSYNKLTSGAGAASVQASESGGAAVGATVVVNTLSGNTKATVDGSSLYAYYDSEADASADSATGIAITYNEVDEEDRGKVKSATKTVKGIAVVAKSEQELLNVALTAGVSANSSFSAAADATAAVNTIKGETKAGTYNTTFNKNIDRNRVKDVNIIADDKTKLSNHVGSVGVGASSTAGLSAAAAVDTNTLNRTVTAESVNSADTRAKKLNVYAVNANDLLLTESGVAVGAGSSVGGSGTGVVSVNEFKGTTKARVDNHQHIEVKEANVDAERAAKQQSYTNGVAVSGGAVAVAGSVGLVKTHDISTTVSELNNSYFYNTYGLNNIFFNDTSNQPDITLRARNNQDVIGEVGALAGAAGIGGAAGVTVGLNELESTVATNMENTTIGTDDYRRAKKVDITASNTFSTHFINAAAAGGAVGLGVGVGVNTINSAAVNNIKKSTIYASDVNISANSSRSLQQEAVAGSGGIVGLSTNVMITTVGDSIADSYEYDGGTYSMDNINTINKNAMTKQHDTLDAYDDYKYTSAGIDDSLKQESTNLSGRTIEAKGVATNIVGSRIQSRNDMNISNVGNTNADIKVAQGSIGYAGNNVSVGIAQVNDNLQLLVENSSLLSRSKINLSNLNKDDLKVNTYQGAVAVAESINVGYSYLKHGGDNVIDLRGADFTGISYESVNVKAVNDNKLNNAIYAGAGSSVAAGVLIAKTEDDSNVKVNIAKVNNNATKFGSRYINILANNAPHLTSQGFAANGGLLAAAGSVAIANAKGSARVIVGDDNRFDTGNYVEFKAVSGDETNNGQYTTEAKVQGVSAGLAEATVNKAMTDNSMTTEIKVGKEAFGSYADVKLKAINATSSNLDVRGIDIGSIASGTNIANAKTGSKVNISLDKVANSWYVDVQAINKDTITAEANGDGGGFADISPVAAAVWTDLQGTTEVNIIDDIKTHGYIDIKAQRLEDLHYYADALEASVAGGSGVEVDNKVANATQINIKNANLTADTSYVKVQAENDVNINKLNGKEQQMLESGGYGGGNLTLAFIDNKIDDKATVNITDSTITAANSVTVAANAKDDVALRGYVNSLGLLEGASVDVDSDITNTQAVNLTNASLNATSASSDVTISAADELTENAYSYAETDAAVLAVTLAFLNDSVTRNNAINLDGNSKLYGARDINLYAGRMANGSLATLNQDLEVRVFDGSLVPFGNMVYSPKVKNSITQTNTIDIGSSASVTSVRNTNLYADVGREIVNTEVGKFSNYSSSATTKFVTTEAGESIDSKTNNNKVNIAGQVVAGVADKINIVIGAGDGTVEIVVLNSDEDAADNEANFKAVKEYYKNDSSVKVVRPEDATITFDINPATGLSRKSLVFGTEDIGNSLYSRYVELGSLASEYEGSNAAAGYQAEMMRIANLMATMNLAEVSNGKITRIKNNYTVQYVEVPDLVTSGGNINIHTRNLTGVGSLEAKGSPNVSITNNTELMLKVNSVSMDSLGGSINYNNYSLKGSSIAERRNEINTINKSSKNADFKAVAVSAGTPGSINITGNYYGVNGSKNIHYKGTDGKTYDIIPMADIKVQGNITNSVGSVNITSKNDNITIEGKESKDDVSINALEVKLNAPKGSINQGYTDSIVNVGADPQSQYTFAMNRKDPDENHADTSTENSTSSWISGNTVYINAADINLNGRVQSGYADYFVDIGDDALDMISEIKRTYGNGKLSDNTVMGNDSYCIVYGGPVFKGDHYEYRLSAYYNPSTDTILVENVDASGGQIYLTGRISNTSGKGVGLICLDGASDISVNNATRSKLKLGDMLNSEVKGLVQIADLQKGELTRYTRDQAEVYKLEKGSIYPTGTPKVTALNNGEATYNPYSGLRYYWTKGQNWTDYKKYSKEVVTNWWGAGWDDISTSQINSWSTQNNLESSGTSSSPTAKRNGEYIGTTGSNTSYFFNVDFNSKTINSKTTNNGTDRWKTGFLGFYKHTKYKWTVESGVSETYTASVKADNPVGVKFIGNYAEAAVVNVVSTGDIELQGNVGNKEVYSLNHGKDHVEKGSVNIISTGGSINQTGGNIYGANVNLAAAGDMKGINIIAGDTVNLSAINLETEFNYGDILTTAYQDEKRDYYFLEHCYKTDNVTVETLKETKAPAITQRVVKKDDAVIDINVGANALAKGNVVLGSIGSYTGSGSCVEVYSGENNHYELIPAGTGFYRKDDAYFGYYNAYVNYYVSTSSKDSVTARQAADSTGSVSITASGDISQRPYASRVILNVYNGTNKNDYNSYTLSDNLIAANKISLTSTNGSIYGYDSYHNMRVQTGENVINNDTLSASINANAKGDIALEQISGNMRVGKIYSEEGDVSIKVEDGALIDALPYLQTNRADADELLTKWAEIGVIEYNDNADVIAEKKAHFAALATKETDPQRKAALENLAANYKPWEADALLYAISDAIVNPDSHALPSTSAMDPNIIGRNINLDVKDSAGLNSGISTTIDLTTLLDKDAKGNLKNLDKLQQLAKADITNVEVTKEGEYYTKATIKDLRPLGIQQTTDLSGKLGSLTVTTTNSSKGDVYIQGRDQKTIEQAGEIYYPITDNKELQLGTIKAMGETVISSLGGIYSGWNNILNDPEDIFEDLGYIKPVITTKSLYLTAAGGAIGTEYNPLTAIVGDSMAAVSSSDIYFYQTNNTALKLRNISSGGSIFFTSKGDLMNMEPAYIRTEKDGDVFLTSVNGKISNLSEIYSGGSAELYAGDTIENQKHIQAKGDIYLQATNSIKNYGLLEADKCVDLETLASGSTIGNYGIFNYADIVSGERTLLMSQGRIINGTSEGDYGNIYSDGYVQLHAMNDISNHAGWINAKSNVYLASWQGSVANDADITSTEGEVGIFAAYNHDALRHEDNLSRYLKDYYLDKSIKAVSTTGNVTNKGSIKALEEIKVMSYNGNVDNHAAISTYSLEELALMGKEEKGAGKINIGAFIDKNYVEYLISTKGEAGIKDLPIGNVNNAIDAASYLDAEMKARNYIAINAQRNVDNSGSMLVENAKLDTGISILAGVSTDMMTTRYDLGTASIYNNDKIKLAGGGFIRMLAQNDVINMAQIESHSGDVTLNSVYGSVINMQNADVIALGGDVAFRTGSSIDLKDMDAYGEILKPENKWEIKDRDGQVINPVYIMKQDGTKSYLAKDGSIMTMEPTAAGYQDGMANVVELKVTKSYSRDGENWTEISSAIPNLTPGDIVKTVVEYKLAGSDAVQTLEVKAEGQAHSDAAVFRNGAVVNFGELIALSDNAPVADKGKLILNSAYSDVYNYDDPFTYNNELFHRNGEMDKTYTYLKEEVQPQRAFRMLRAAKAPEPAKEIYNLGAVKLDLKAENGAVYYGGVMFANNNGNESLELNLEGDVILSELNAKNVKITTNGKIGIDNLKVTGYAYFDAMGYKTSVFGNSGSRSDSKASYVVGKDGMSLYIDSPNHQRSNGILMHLDKSYFVDLARQPMEVVISPLSKEEILATYKNNLEDSVGLFNRYNLWETDATAIVNLSNIVANAGLETMDEDETKK